MSEVRNRTSCEPCRKRKIKCDALLPCASCVMRKVQKDCHYRIENADTSPNQSHGSTSTLVQSPADRPTKRRRQSPDRQPRPQSHVDLQSMKTSVRQIQAHIESLENQLEGSIAETDDPVERGNWRRVMAVIPEKAIVEVLLEYLLQECDWLRRSSNIPNLWQTAIARCGVSSSVAGLLCMSLAIPSLFLGPYQTPLYQLPIDTSKLHCDLFATAQTFVSDARDLDELELLEMLIVYSVYNGRNDLIGVFLGRAMSIATNDGWLDENSAIWRDFDRGERDRARLVLGEIASSFKWSLLMVTDRAADLRINLCRPQPPTYSLESPIRLSLPGTADLPLRIFRLRSSDEIDMGVTYRDLILDFSFILPRVRCLLETLMIHTSSILEDALAQSARLQQELQEWRLVKLPNANLSLPNAREIDLQSPLSCHRAARALLLHSAVTCVEGIITRHWLTAGRNGPPIQQYLHDECLLNAQRSFDSIPVVRAMLETRHAPFCSSFVICGLFNAATSFAIPLLRAVAQRQGLGPGGRSVTEHHIHNLPAWPENLLPLSLAPPVSSTAAIDAHAYHDSDIKVYANNILVVLDMLSVLNALPCGQAAQDRLEGLVQQFDLRSAPRNRAPMSIWSGGEVGGCPAATGIADMAGALSSGMPGAADPFAAMWDGLLQLDPSIWVDLLTGADGETVS